MLGGCTQNGGCLSNLENIKGLCLPKDYVAGEGLELTGTETKLYYLDEDGNEISLPRIQALEKQNQMLMDYLGVVEWEEVEYFYNCGYKLGSPCVETGEIFRVVNTLTDDPLKKEWVKLECSYLIEIEIENDPRKEYTGLESKRIFNHERCQELNNLIK